MIRKIVLIMIFAFVLMPGAGICEDIEWKKYSEGIRIARQESKKVFLHFRTDWCGYCRQMERFTFHDEKVVRFLNEHFVSIKVDGDAEKMYVKAHKVTGYPDNRFLDEQRKEVHRLPGFVDSSAFLFFLEYIKTDSYKTMDPMQYYKSR